jgi:hypothetical protein
VASDRLARGIQRPLDARRTGVGVRIAVEVQLPEDAGRGDALVTLDGDLGARLLLAEAVGRRHAVLGERKARLLGTVERLAEQGQDAAMVVFEVVVAVDAAPKGALRVG